MQSCARISQDVMKLGNGNMVMVIWKETVATLLKQATTKNKLGVLRPSSPRKPTGDNLSQKCTSHLLNHSLSVFAD